MKYNKKISKRMGTIKTRPTIKPEYLKDGNEYIKEQRDMFSLGVVVGMIMGSMIVFTICSLIVMFD